MPRMVVPTDESIAEATRRLHDGEVIVFPTETVYGLGADTFNPAALECVYRLKGRPQDNPLIAHVLDWEAARNVIDLKAQVLNGGERGTLARSLASTFWPGPLTLVLPKADHVPSRATGGRNTIAVRSPAHPVARKLLEQFGGPISAPSANRSGRVSPTTAQHVSDDFARVDDPAAQNLLILDGGACEVGIESTVLDLSFCESGARPRVLRPGSITVDQLRRVIGDVDVNSIHEQGASPGTAALHYAPRTPAELVDRAQLSQRLCQPSPRYAVLAFDASAVPSPHVGFGMPSDATSYARVLYGVLRQADAAGCARILIERPPDESEPWRAIHDRLRRATASDASQCS